MKLVPDRISHDSFLLVHLSYYCGTCRKLTIASLLIMTPADTITAIGSLNHFCGLCTQNQKPITTQDTAKPTPFLGSISTFYFFFGGVAQHRHRIPTT